MMVLGMAVIGPHVSAATPNLGPTPANAAPANHAAARVAQSSFIVQAPSLALALAAVKNAGGSVTREFGIINAVAANLTPAQAAALRADRRLILTPNKSAALAGSASPAAAGSTSSTAASTIGPPARTSTAPGYA